MKLLSVFGLILDLIGVLLLGFDLLRVQRKLQTDAQSRLAALADIVKSTGDVDSFLKNISADWRNYVDIGEGLYEPEADSFDVRSAQNSLDEIKCGISGIADDLHTLAQMMLINVQNDKKTVKLSLGLTYSGLALIVCGFLLQTLAYY